MDHIAFRCWQQDVLRSLGLQWGLCACLVLVSAFFSWQSAINATLAGAAVALPNTALGAWMGIRLLFGSPQPASVLTGAMVRTVFSAVLLGVAFVAAQEIGWVWQGFFAGLVVISVAPMLSGLLPQQRGV